MTLAVKDFFPLDEEWGLSGAYSPERARQMVWLSGLLPYQQAQEVFERIGHCLISSSSLWKQTQQHGERLEAHLKHQQDFVRPERVRLPPPGQDHTERKGVSMDGGMVHIRGEGWKEMKVGTIYDVERRLEREKETRELVERPQALNQTYTAVLGTVNQFAPAFWVAAVQHDVPQAADLSVTADGAAWIWNLTADYFPDSIQIVDWYHACEHLAKCAQALFPDDPAAARRWYRQRQEPLFLGNIQALTRELEAAGLPEFAHYFHTHQRRMHYLEFLEECYPIGSGTVESAIKQFKLRLTGPGMRWSRPGAERMLVIRSAVLGHTFDLLWNQAA